MSGSSECGVKPHALGVIRCSDSLLTSQFEAWREKRWIKSSTSNTFNQIQSSLSHTQNAIKAAAINDRGVRTGGGNHTLYKLITLITQASRWKIFLLPWRTRTSCNDSIATAECKESNWTYVYRGPMHNIRLETFIHALHHPVSNSLCCISMRCFMNPSHAPPTFKIVVGGMQCESSSYNFTRTSITRCGVCSCMIRSATL